MKSNGTYLLAQNGIPGAYSVKHPFLANTPPSPRNADSTMQRRDSTISLDTLAREKEEAHATTTARSGLRSTLSSLAHRLSSAVKEKQLIAGQAAGARHSVHEHEPFQVYVVGNQVVYLGPGSTRRT